MQQSSMGHFCDECGLANEATASHCASCQRPLIRPNQEAETPPIAPVTFTPQPVLEVRAGAPLDLEAQEARVTPAQSATCDFRPGSILAGRYQIQEEIGHGGFSTVYRAVDQQTGSKQRLVAIKRIQLEKLSPREAIDATETFYREVAMLARVKGLDGIPAYYEYLTDAGNWYLVTQYIEGQTLEDYLQKVPEGYLEEQEVITLGIKLAEILHKLHITSPPVIFRDLKPANIMLTPENKVFLIDFGIARSFTRDKARDTIPLGTPGYAPPEQYGRTQTGPRSDIYSLGATLQTLLTGRDPVELAEGQSSRNPKAISPRFRKFLDEMLSSEASRRPKDMTKVQSHLEALKYQPKMIFMMGVVYGCSFSLLALLGLLLLPSSFRPWINFVGLYVAKITEDNVRHKLKLPPKDPKGLWGYWCLGMLTCGLAIFLLAHIFFSLPF